MTDLSIEDVNQLPLPVFVDQDMSILNKHVMPDKTKISIHPFSPERIVLRPI